MRKAHYSPSTFNKYINSLILESDKVRRLSQATSIREWLQWHKAHKSISSREYHLAIRRLEQALQRHNPPLFQKKLFMIGFFACVFLLTVFIITLKNRDKGAGDNQEDNTSRIVTLPFSGILKNLDGTVVNTKKDVIFRLYPDKLGGQPLYTGQCIGEKGLVPEYDGSFTIVLGSDCGMPPLTQALLDTYKTLYLGVQIGSDVELTPRTLIASGSYGGNASKLQNLSVGSIAGTIPFINQQNIFKLTESNPTLLSTNGTFKIQGQKLILNTTLEQGGDIRIQPAIGANTLIMNGNVGVGIPAPQHKVSVWGLEPYKSIMSVINTSPEDIRTSSVLDLSLGASRNGNNATFVNFIAEASQEAPGTNVGRIHLGNGGVVYETKGADFAEYFDTDNGDLFMNHMIVGISTDGIRPAKKGDRMIGVITDTPGFIGNSPYTKREKSILVGLMGQVTVLVTNENGPIHMGDLLTVGSIAGYGVKDISTASEIIGVALENGTEQRCNKKEGTGQKKLKCGKIRILIDTTR